MPRMIIYEPAMCCATGLCGVGTDPELLRISTVVNTLKKSGLTVNRFNLSSNPQEFIKNAEVNKVIMDTGIDSLPITVVDGKIVRTAGYPTNEELLAFLELPANLPAAEAKPLSKMKLVKKPKSGCSCGDGC